MWQNINSLIFQESQFSVRSNLHIIVQLEPQKVFSCPVPHDMHTASCVVPPYQPAWTWKYYRNYILGCILPFQSRSSMRHTASQTSVVSTGPGCSVPSILILLCTLQKLLRRHLPYMPHRLPPCTEACVPCNQNPHLLGSEVHQPEKEVQKDKILIIPRQNFFSPLLLIYLQSSQILWGYFCTGKWNPSFHVRDAWLICRQSE